MKRNLCILEKWNLSWRRSIRSSERGNAIEKGWYVPIGPYQFSLLWQIPQRNRVGVGLLHDFRCESTGFHWFCIYGEARLHSGWMGTWSTATLLTHGNQKAQGRGGAVYTYEPIPPEPLDTTVRVCFPPQSHSLESFIDIQKCAFPVTL